MDNLRYTIALTLIPRVGSIIARHLIQTFGSAEGVLQADRATLLSIPRIGPDLVNAGADSRLLDRADAELRFIEAHHIQALCYGDAAYPHRLLDCPDAPVLLYQLGASVTESQHVLSIVGTRSCTQTGRDNTRRIVAELHEMLPDLVVVSGLALGIDVAAHRAALEFGVPTIAVVAHGLDRIYPAQHRDVARQIVASGGAIISEFPHLTQIERGFFLQRNRIVAGLADAVLVSESKDKGGSMVTASIALDYARDVFAFPARVDDECNRGCNRLIRLRRAELVTCAQDLADSMGWHAAARHTAVQQTLNFAEDNLPPLQHSILDVLGSNGDLRLSQLCEYLPASQRAEIQMSILDLELSGHIIAGPGGTYHRRT